MVPPLTRDAWFLTGPTAGAKTVVGIELALLLGAEVISMDSMALYRRLDLGTAKPTLDERARVPHHLIDVAAPHEEYSLARYLDAASACAAEVGARGRVPLFVGGTPLYLKGLLRGIFRGPEADPDLRRRLEDEARRLGPEVLHRRLAQVDPAAGARLHPHDVRRVIRALEVYEKTGRPISELQQQFDRGRPAGECRVFALDWPRAELYERIGRRVDAMFAAGLVEEVRGLLGGGREKGTGTVSARLGPSVGHATEPVPFSSRQLSKTARQALGYREVLEHLAGARDLRATIDLVKTRTRQFAKRQGTWFRSLSECRFVPVSGQIDPAAVARRIAAGSRLNGLA